MILPLTVTVLTGISAITSITSLITGINAEVK